MSVECVCDVAPRGVLDCVRCLSMDTTEWVAEAEALARSHPRYRKARIPVAIRRAVYDQDGHQCVSCGSDTDLSVDHIVAERRGGATTLSNLQTMCRSCNSRKGVRQ